MGQPTYVYFCNQSIGIISKKVLSKKTQGLGFKFDNFAI